LAGTLPLFRVLFRFLNGGNFEVAFTFENLFAVTPVTDYLPESFLIGWYIS